MFKKLLAGITIVGALAFGFGFTSQPLIQHAYASTISQAKPVSSIGTYNDFGQIIDLQWKQTLGAHSYNVYLAKGYNARTGFTFQKSVPYTSIRYINRQYWVVSNINTPTMGWYTVEVTAVDVNGIESAPCYASVNIIR